MMGLRTHFNNHFADWSVSALYQGYMDVTFFALFPSALKCHSLKVAVLFNYEVFRFEGWLAGRNRKVQKHYWELLKDGEWPGYRIFTPGKGVDSILVCDLAREFDLSKSRALTSVIETTTVEFIDAVEESLSGYEPLKGTASYD